MTTVDSDSLPPTQYLILEVLAARHRTGETLWTFPSRLRSQMTALAGLGLVGWKSGVTEGHPQARYEPGTTRRPGCGIDNCRTCRSQFVYGYQDGRR